MPTYMRFEDFHFKEHMRLKAENEKLLAHNKRLIEACEKAKRGFLNLIDIDVLPSSEYDDEAQKLANYLHLVIFEENENAAAT